MDTDLHIKYQKLGQEYQKLRAQVSVLKKGVIDEQAHSKILQELSKQKDQSIRKYEQELDSLQFRNEQLSKRVEILQTDLDVWERGGTRPKAAVDYKPNEIDENVREQELKMKITENEVLHEQLQEANQQHQIVSSKLEERLEVLEREAGSHNKVLDETNARYNRIVERLQEDRAMMEGKIKKEEEELKIANIMVEKYQKQLKGTHNELKAKLEKTTQILKEKVPFNDTDNLNLNLLNVPVCDRAHQVQARELVESFTNYFIDFMASLSDFHTYQEQRLSIFSVDMQQEQLSPINLKFSSYLHENAHINRHAQQAMKKFNDCLKAEYFISLETSFGLQQLSQSFNTCSKYLEKLLPYQILSIEEECRLSSCTEAIERENKKFLKLAKQFTSTFTRLNRYLSLLASFSENKNIKAKNIDCFKLLCKQLVILNASAQEMCTTYYAKMGAEDELPMITERLKNTDQCIASSLAAMATATNKFVSFFNEHIDFIGRPCGFKRKGVVNGGEQAIVSCVKSFQSKAAGFLQSLQKDVPVTIAYDLAVKNNRTLVTSTESRDTLAEEVLNTRKSIAKLEQEKQHWMLESQLIKAKFDKEVKKVAALGEELGKMKTESLHTRSPSETIDDLLQRDKPTGSPMDSPALTRQVSSSSSSVSVEQPVYSQPIGTMEAWSKERDSGDADRDHEELVKNHLTSRISDITKQLQQADSKTVTHYSECRALYKQLVLADKSKKKIANELSEAKRKVINLDDDLETTKRSYEDQIKMLSDHLCGMNDKLTSQKDQIDQLKTATPTNKSSSKLGFGRKKQ